MTEVIQSNNQIIADTPESSSLIQVVESNEIGAETEQTVTEQVSELVENTLIKASEEVLSQVQSTIETTTVTTTEDISNEVNLNSVQTENTDLVQLNTANESDEQPEIKPEPIIKLESDHVPQSKQEIAQQKEDQQINVQSTVTATLNPLDTMTDMTASFIAKTRISTEEEAKAALAERRRLAREEAERQAELERLRLEEEERQQLQRQLEEEEEQRRMEEEATRLAALQRKAEYERLSQAIEEAQKREEEEKLRREEENRLKIEREESERKAREEAEKQRIETAERLKKEEKEREERRKRVEAIMARTRAKGGNGNAKVSTFNSLYSKIYQKIL